MKIERLKLKYLKQAKEVFNENYYKNGGMLRVKSISPSLFNYKSFFIALSGDEVLGYIRVHKNYKLSKSDIIEGHEFRKSNIYVPQEAVKKDYQGRGIGLFLLRFVGEYYKGKALYNHVSTKNGASTRMVTGLGYIKVGYCRPKSGFHGDTDYSSIIYYKENI